MNQVRIKGLLLEELEEVFSYFPSSPKTKVKVRALETVEEMKGKRHGQDKTSPDGKLEREV